MKLNKIYSAILLSTLPLTPAFAAGLDRSGQSISVFLQPGNYAEAGISVLDPTVKSSQLNVTDMAEDYYFPSAAIKVQATEQISLGLLYDQPFGADAMYNLEQSMFTNGIEATKVEVETHNLTALIGYQPTENWNFYAGPVWQTVEADISLRGQAYISPKDPTKVLSGYDIKIHEEEAFGWLAGFAYQIPEIALKTSVTYRSEIKHKAKSVETHKLMPMLNVESQLDAITPQSVNIDFQTGVAANTLAFANIRWVHWDQFAVTPKFLNAASGNNLIDYSDDQWSATVGVGRKFNSHWSGSASVGYDSGAGNPVTTLGPTEGYWSVGLGGQYSPAENYFIQAGVKYFWLGDAKAKRGTDIVGDFEDNHALGYGMKIGYRF
ncbi:MAG: OmpP1/FadL family transporter [Acinetobacter sp.]|uniref:OmpP1/FadL family transporter n=1 Tax=Acinetobacter sp. TaxID=472 RepID=UPI0039187C0F